MYQPFHPLYNKKKNEYNFLMKTSQQADYCKEIQTYFDDINKYKPLLKKKRDELVKK